MVIINIGFWNAGLLHDSDNPSKIEAVNNAITKLICENNLDILALCEYPIHIPLFLEKDHIRDREYEEASYIVDRSDTRIFYSKITVHCVSEAMIDYQHHSMNRFISNGLEFNLSCVHLPSKLHTDEETRCYCISKTILPDIEKYETEFDDKTIIVGDFNADPYESSMLSANGFHALPDRNIRQDIKLQGILVKAFYNPMWNLYGDMIKPSGTHYHNSSQARNQYWYILDQVILRYSMIDRFIDNSLKIIFEGFQNRCGNPGVSDHYPIIFSLN